jgi:hypothetical protein
VEGNQDDGQPQPSVEEEDDDDGTVPSNNGKSSHNGMSHMGINSKVEILESKSVADPKPSEGNFPLRKNRNHGKRSSEFKGQAGQDFGN